MKSLVFVLIFSISNLVLAGGSVGTMKAAQEAALKSAKERLKLNPPQIIFNKGQQNGATKISYGQLVDNEWQVQDFELADVDVSHYPEISEALKLSQEQQAWVEVK